MEVVGSRGEQVGGPKDMQKRVEDMQKRVEDRRGAGRGQEGPEEVGKVVGECGRDGKAWECNATLQVEDIHIILMLCSV